MLTTTTAGGSSKPRTNSISTNVCMESSVFRGCDMLGLVAETAPVDAIAQRRPFDLQQLRRLRLIAVADFQRPEDQVRLELAQAIVEGNGCRRPGRKWRAERRIRGLAAGAEQNARRHAADADGSAGAGLGDALARVLQLAHVARPPVAHERLTNRLRDLGLVFPRTA